MRAIIRHPIISLVAGLLIGTLLVLNIRPESAVEFAASIPLQDKGISTFYVNGQIQGVGDVEFLVDTGAGYTTINEATLSTLQERKQVEYSRDLSGVLADGTVMRVPVYRIASITLGGCNLRNVEAAVFPGKTRFLLGMNALRQTAPFAFVTEPQPQLVLGRCNGVHAL